MHLALLTYSFPPEIGGVQTYLYETMRRIAQGENITVVSPLAEKIPGHTNLQKYQTPDGRAHSMFAALNHLKPDKVLIGHAHPQLLLAAMLYTRRHTASLTHGNDYLAAQQRWHRPLFNWLLGQSRPLITTTQTNQERLCSLGLPQATVIYPGTDPANFSPQPQAKAIRPTILTVSRLVSRKGIDVVLQALPTLLSLFPDLQYEIVGDGPDWERLQSLVNTHGLTDFVTFHGRLSNSELLATYRRAHIFVMPAREELENASIEGFGIVFLEASACGLPVVAGRSGGVSEAVLDGETGFLVPPNDSQYLAQTLTNLLQTPEQMQKLGSNGRRWVETEMNWEHTAQKLHKALINT